MSFAVAFKQPVGRRLKMITEQGAEEYEQPKDKEAEFLQFVEGKEEQQAEQKQAAPPPDPHEAIEKFVIAKGELDVMVDVITFLENNHCLGVDNVTKPRSALDWSNEAALKLQRKKAALQDAAARLRRGAHALRTVIATEENFYTELSRLQKFWKLKLNPAGSNTPFLVDLSFVSPPSCNQRLRSTTPPLPANDPLLTPPAIIKEPGGALRVQLDPPPDAAPTTLTRVKRTADGHIKPTVYAGARAVHAMLLERQQALLLRSVTALLEKEAASSSATNMAMYKLATSVVDTLSHTQDPCLARVRPILLDHFITHHIPEASTDSKDLPPFDKPPPSLLPRTPSLLYDMHQLLSHLFLEGNIRSGLEQEAHAQPKLSMKFAVTGRGLVSANVLRLPGAQQLLAIVRDSGVEVEGVVRRNSATRWARDTQVSVFKNEARHIISLIRDTRRL